MTNHKPSLVSNLFQPIKHRKYQVRWFLKPDGTPISYRWLHDDADRLSAYHVRVNKLTPTDDPYKKGGHCGIVVVE